MPRLYEVTIGSGTLAPPVSDRPFFTTADWLWNPIPANPAIDPQSAGMVATLSKVEVGDGDRLINIYDYGVVIKGPDGITASTPRYDIEFANVPSWGSDPFGSFTMPVPDGTPVPPGTDGAAAVIDPTVGKVFSLWQANLSGTTKRASWGAMTDLQSDGRESTGSSSGAGIPILSGMVRLAELAAGEIKHALTFSTNRAPTNTWRYPATKTDGNKNPANYPGEVLVPEGVRFQLDPSINLSSISGITDAEIVIGTCMQRYGAYCIDNGGVRMAFGGEFEGGSSPTWASLGIGWDYFGLTHIPWTQMRALATWNGA